MNGPIIAGVDGSERSRDALALSQELAAVLDARVIAVHIIEWGALAGFQYESLPEDVRTIFDEVLNEISDSERDGIERLVSEAGIGEAEFFGAASAAEGLHSVAEDRQAQLVVLGSSGRSGLATVFPGTTGRRLLAGSTVPIAVAPPDYAGEAHQLNRIGCALDARSVVPEGVEWGADLALRADAELELVAVHAIHALDDLPLSSRQGLHDYLRQSLEDTVAALRGRIDATPVLLDGDPAGEVAAHSAKLDLLVLGSRAYGPVRSVLAGSISSEIVRSAQCPVVVVPRRAETHELG
jgi:nucleotide-binding universal stress UspA family protein